VTGFTVGDRVAYLGPGTYAEYTLANADRTIVLPKNVSLEQGAGALMTGLTTLMLTKETYRVQPGDTVLIHVNLRTIF
jgi:NADPH2:quinone reductase